MKGIEVRDDPEYSDDTMHTNCKNLRIIFSGIVNRLVVVILVTEMCHMRVL